MIALGPDGVTITNLPQNPPLAPPLIGASPPEDAPPVLRAADDDDATESEGEDLDELDEPEPVHDVPAVDDFDDADFDDDFDDDFEEAFDEDVFDNSSTPAQPGGDDDDEDIELDEEID